MNDYRNMDARTIWFSEIFRDSDNKAVYLSIPQYQRDYSWEKSQIYDLLDTLCSATDESEQSVFLGTLLFDQLEKDNPIFDIVDGQQRITTLLLLIRYIDLQLGRMTVTDDILVINNGDTNREQFQIAWDLEEIEEIKKSKQGKTDVANMKNRYKRCLLYIKAYLDMKLEDEKYDELENQKNEEMQKTDVIHNSLYEKLLSAIFNKTFFVRMITIERPLPQVVKIFNTINSTGLDLNCSDLFKLQFYEYLKSKKGSDLLEKEILPQINKCYEDIAEVNNNSNIFGNVQMSHFLDIYKHILCTGFKSKTVWNWLRKSNETFFDELFSNVADEHNEDYMTFYDFRKAVDIYVELFSQLYDKTNQSLHDLKLTTFLAPELLETTRYSRYWTIPYVYAFFNIQDMTNKEENQRVYIEALKFTEELYKYFLIQSISYEKVINPVQNFICDIVLNGLKRKDDGIIDVIKEQIGISPYWWEKDDNAHLSYINNRLTGNICENGLRARAICILSAVFDEESYIKEGNTVSAFNIRNYFFNWNVHKFDLEHVYSRKDFIDDIDKDKALYNSLGNLVILERRINRQLGNKPFNGYDKKTFYDADKFYAAPKRIFMQCNEWETKQIKDRLYKKTSEIKRYLGI